MLEIPLSIHPHGRPATLRINFGAEKPFPRHCGWNSMCLYKLKRLLKSILPLALVIYPVWATADDYGPNMLPAGSFEGVRSAFVPWAGIDDGGNIHGLDGEQLAVGDDGGIRPYKFGPGIAVGDLTGDGKQDLVLADSKGFFWYFHNNGTPQKPAFGQGEVMPIWLGEERVDWATEGVDNLVPRIQLVDFDGDKRLDLVVGTYEGKLFRIPNIGSSTQPLFKPTYDRDSLVINTHRKGTLWCNYLAPCFTSLISANALKQMDLILGDGSYSANSIYFLNNTGSSSGPAFDEDHLQNIVPGMGLEQLTPVVVDWNNDGKPDIITGDRTGHLTLYLNNTKDLDHPTFEPGQRISIGGEDKFGNATTVAVGDLTGNGLPNLLIGWDNGTVLYALNTGKLGAPVFDTPVTALTGVLPSDYHYTFPTQWHKDGAWGTPYELLACVNPQIEPGFSFPDGETGKYALKFSVWPVKHHYFSEIYYPKIEDQFREHVISCSQGMTLKLNTRYRIHCWIKSDQPVSNFRYRIGAENMHRDGFNAPDITNPIDSGLGWTEFSSEFEVNNSDDPSVEAWRYNFEIHFAGQSTFYIDDLQIQEKLGG